MDPAAATASRTCNDHTIDLYSPVDDPGPSVRAKSIVGYCRPWSVRPGDEVEFMVGSETDDAYRADLVRIGCGDSVTGLDRFRETHVPAAFAGEYRGTRQETRLGSFVHVSSAPALDGMEAFTVQALVYPTLLPSASGRDQHLVSRWDAARGVGWSLSIDERDRAVLTLANASATHVSVIASPLADRRWHLVSAAVDPVAGRVRVRCVRPDSSAAPFDAGEVGATIVDLPEGFAIAQSGDLAFAGRVAGVLGTGVPYAEGSLNGRLERVRLTAGALDDDDVDGLAVATGPLPASIGFWDFSAEISGSRAIDLSPNALHGTLVNLPQRAVTGIDWDGSSSDWTSAPAQFGAIHFHDDDLYDAGWGVAFRYRVPDDSPTGVYAARLVRGEDEDYVPFFVLPPEGEATASVAVLLPTATYTAYSNVTSILTMRALTARTAADGTARIVDGPVADRTLSVEPRHLRTLLDGWRGWGAGVYALHTDGTSRTYASQLHPNMTVKPKGVTWTLTADTYLLDWLERKRIPVDVLTDDALHREGAELLGRYRVVLTGNHPEYYTHAMRDAIDGYLRAGGRLMYLGGNGFYWVTSVPADRPGVVEVRKSPGVAAQERRHASDGVPGGLWRDAGRPPQALVGVGTSGVAMDCASGYRRLPGAEDPRAAFILEGVEGDVFGGSGVLGGGAAGQEVDRIAPELGTPLDAIHVARGDDLHRSHPEAGELDPRPAADVVLVPVGNGGAVFSAGSMAWVGALVDTGDGDSDVSRITENVLRRFLDPAGFDPPAR